MAAVWLSVWAAIDRWLSQPDPRFLPSGIPLLAWYALAIVGLAALLRRYARPAPPFGPTLALTMGAVPVPLFFTGVVAAFLQPSWFFAAGAVVAAYTLLYLARGLRALTGERQRAAACMGLIFIVGFSWLTDVLDVIPDVWTPLESQAAVAMIWHGRKRALRSASPRMYVRAIVIYQNALPNSGRHRRNIGAAGRHAPPAPRPPRVASCSFAAWCARISSKTARAEMARAGSACMAS